jgi:hypothetical protein
VVVVRARVLGALHALAQRGRLADAAPLWLTPQDAAHLYDAAVALDWASERICALTAERDRLRAELLLAHGVAVVVEDPSQLTLPETDR